MKKLISKLLKIRINMLNLTTLLNNNKLITWLEPKLSMFLEMKLLLNQLFNITTKQMTFITFKILSIKNIKPSEQYLSQLLLWTRFLSLEKSQSPLLIKIKDLILAPLTYTNQIEFLNNLVLKKIKITNKNSIDNIDLTTDQKLVGFKQVWTNQKEKKIT